MIDFCIIIVFISYIIAVFTELLFSVLKKGYIMISDNGKTNQELIQQIKEFKGIVKHLNSIGLALSSEHNLARLLTMIVREIRKFTTSDGGTLYIKVGDELSFEVAQNDTLSRRHGDTPFIPFKIPINNKSIAGYVASKGNTLNISDLGKVGDDVTFSLKTMREFDVKMNYQSVSMLAVPMRDHKDNILGVIQLINALDSEGKPKPFSLDMQELVISLASQAAVAIANSRFILQVKNLFESIVTYSAQAIDARSPHTAGHSHRVSQLALSLAGSINDSNSTRFADVVFSEEGINELRIAALLHDIGKIGVRERVLDKMNKLSDDRVEAVENRFAFIRNSIELMYKNKLIENQNLSIEEISTIENETNAKIEQLEKDLALILKVNLPKYYSDEEGERMEEISKQTYFDIEGNEKPLITEYEYTNLLVRKGNLTGEERKEIESHVTHTLNILEQIPFTEEFRNIPSIAATHHEMLNGTGYPNGLSADDIPLQARMLAVADIFDALTARDRPYKPPLPLPITIKILREEAGDNRLDSDLVELFIEQECYNVLD